MHASDPSLAFLAPPPRKHRGPRPTKRRAVTPGDIERFVDEARNLVPMFARRYLGRGVPFEDLVGAGNLGVVEAAHRYDPGRGVRFGTYAAWWIRKAIAGALEKEASVVSIPRDSFMRRRRLLDVIASRRDDGARASGATELAQSAGMSVRQVEQALAFFSSVVSLETPTGRDGHRRLEDQLSRPAGEGPEALTLHRDRARCARAALSVLSPRQQQVVILRFGLEGHGNEPATFAEVAAILGLSRERVRQIEVQALSQVRRALTGSGWGDVRPRLSPSTTRS